MAENIRQPDPPSYAYGVYKTLPGTAKIPSQPDTFIGPRDKAYADFIARDVTRLRGINGFYFVKDDQTRRIDGDRPISSPAVVEANVLARKRHAGMALYGEQLIVGSPIDSVRHEVQPDWPFLDPILVRGLVYELEREEDADARGAIYTNRGLFDLARVLCEREWKFKPQPGDVIHLPTLGNRDEGPGGFEGYFDVEDVSRDDYRWGGTGFHTVFKLTLVRSSKFEPQRKIAERKLTTDDEIKDRS